jgi:hypothetical protein
MDEILIEEKRYVSSKRAAKVTGYAKDYIGQLCREGRVPARLVGRSWYVLESAIHDHRFGNPEPKVEEAAPSKQTPTSHWEAPRYEAAQIEILPSVNRLRDIVPATEEKSEAIQPLHDSWRAWFDRATSIESTASAEEESVEEAPEAVEEEQETEEVSIPIHTVYELPPEDLLPQRHTEEDEAYEEVQEIQIQRRVGKGIVRTIQMAGVVSAMLIATVAAIGTGYFDKYMISNKQVGLIAGVALYNK